MENPQLSYTGIDHFVLTVDDIDRSCTFYESIGGEIRTFSRRRKAVHFGDQKINLHRSESSDITPVAAAPQAGSGDFCLLVNETIDRVIDILEKEGIPLVLGPVDRTGANGSIQSVYVRDPDGNLVELSTYL